MSLYLILQKQHDDLITILCDSLALKLYYRIQRSFLNYIIQFRNKYKEV